MTSLEIILQTIKPLPQDAFIFPALNYSPRLC
jgi:hypothetical protein